MRIESIRPNLTKTLAALIELLRARMADESFLRRHRRDEKCFTRVRVLPFGVVMILLLQKTAKSIQRHLHEFLAGLEKWAGPRTVTAGAWTQARAKFRHTAFIELNEQCVLPTVYRVVGDWRPNNGWRWGPTIWLSTIAASRVLDFWRRSAIEEQTFWRAARRPPLRPPRRCLRPMRLG